MAQAVHDQKEFLRELKKSPPVVIVYSSDHIVSEELYAHYLKKLSAENPDIEKINLNGLEADAAVFHAEISTIPMFSTGRLIWLRHADGIIKKLTAGKTVTANILRDFANMPADTFLMMQFDEKKLPAALGDMKKNALIYEEKKLRERDLPAFIHTRAASMGFELEEGAAILLAEKCAYDQNQVTNSLNRLFTLALSEKIITKADIKGALDDMQGDLHFSLIDDIAAGNSSAAVSKFLQLKMVDPLMTCGGWIRVFTDALGYHHLRSGGVSAREAHELLDLKVSHDWLFKKREKQFSSLLNHYRPAGLLKVLDRLKKLDADLKENNSLQIQKSLMVMFLSELTE